MGEVGWVSAPLEKTVILCTSILPTVSCLSKHLYLVYQIFQLLLGAPNVVTLCGIFCSLIIYHKPVMIFGGSNYKLSLWVWFVDETYPEKVFLLLMVASLQFSSSKSVSSRMEIKQGGW